jgi:hypothetical protein
MAVHGKVKAVGAASMGEMELEKLGYFLNGRANETPVSISTAASGQTACATLRRLFASDSSQAISTIRFSLGGAAAYDAIFEKNICHGVSGNPAQKKIVMLGGHLDHYLHGERLLRKGVKDKAIELWRFVEQEGASASTPPVTKAVRFDARHRQRELNYDGVRREMANIQNAMW